MLELIGTKLDHALPLLADVEIRQVAQRESDEERAATRAQLARMFPGT